MPKVELTTVTASTLTLAFSLTIIGIILLEPLLINLAAISLVLAFVSYIVTPPSEISLQRSLSKTRCRVGEEIEVTLEITAKKGLGLIVVKDNIPEKAEIVKGTNIYVLSKGIKPLKKTLKYSLKFFVKGEYTIGPLDIETVQLLTGRSGIKATLQQTNKIVVYPKEYIIRRIRTIPTKTKIPIPLSSISRLGPVTTDFKEIREYRYGDPFKFINWKATARLGFKNPLVNEFEREGRKTIMLLLDGTPNMLPGPEASNPFEQGIRALLSLSRYFTSHSFNVFVVVAGHGIVIPPGTGSEHHYRILRTVVKLKTVSTKYTIKESLEIAKRWIIECNPMAIFFTNLNEDSYRDVLDALKIFSVISSHRRGRIPIIIVDISPNYLLARNTKYPDFLLLYSTAVKHNIYRRVKRMGVTVVRWDVGYRDFGQVLGALLKVIK